MDELSEEPAGLTLLERVARLQVYLFREKCGAWIGRGEASTPVSDELVRCQADTDVCICSQELASVAPGDRARVWDSWRDFNQWVDWTDWYLKPK